MTARRVLLVELQADQHHGHYPVVFAELADHLVGLGCEVAALTRRGWRLEGDPAFGPLEIHRFGPVAEPAYRWSARLKHLRPRETAGSLSTAARTLVVTAVARRLARRGRFTDIVLVSEVDPVLADMVVGDRRWLSYQFAGPSSTSLDRLVTRIARHVAARRTSRLRVVSSVDAGRRVWADRAPWLAPVTIPFLSARTRASLPDARRSLGINEEARVALLFGVHARKDPEVVWRAFTELPEWSLVVAGGPAATRYREWAARAHPDGPSPILIDGYVDDATRARLHAASDIVVVSYRPEVQSDSGNVVDAVTWGRTIVCSDGCPSADVVRQFSLGEVFTPGDVEALRAAVRAAPPRPDDAGLAAARAEFAGDRIAERNLAALDEIDRPRPER